METRSNVVTVKRYVNKLVHLISTYAAMNPEDTFERWDGKRKGRIEVKRPHCAKKCNCFKGGFDLADAKRTVQN